MKFKACCNGVETPLGDIYQHVPIMEVLPGEVEGGNCLPTVKETTTGPYASFQLLPSIEPSIHIERAVVLQLQAFLDGTLVLDPFQSGFCHRTESSAQMISGDI